MTGAEAATGPRRARRTPGKQHTLRARTVKRSGPGNRPGTASAFDVVSQFVEALTARDIEAMESLHTDDYIVDWVYGDAFADPARSAEQSAAFFPSWFIGFDDMDYEVKRTIAADDVVVTEWVFTGTHTGPLGPPVFENTVEATGRTIRFRGVTIYEVTEGLIHRETIYMDLATLIVELGAEM